MVTLEFKNLKFHDNNDFVRVIFLKRFHIDVPLSELENVGKFQVEDNGNLSIEGKENAAKRKVLALFYKHLYADLKDVKERKAVFIDKPPLIGAHRFGILESDTNCIEIRPITGCDLNCIYCSVGEGINCKKTQYVIDRGILVSELKKLIDLKKEPLYIHISSQGEPLLYAEIVDLVQDISKFGKIREISLGTTGVGLSKELVDDLVKAGLTRINLSLNSIDKQLASKIAGCDYGVDRILDIAEYASDKLNLILAPVLLQGINEEEMLKIIKFAKKIKAKVGIQNFLKYRDGRNPVKQLEWEDFYKLLKEWENELDIELTNPNLGFKIEKQKALRKPFRKGRVVNAEFAFSGYAKADNRLIKISGLTRVGSNRNLRLKILRDKHNIFVGRIV